MSCEQTNERLLAPGDPEAIERLRASTADRWLIEKEDGGLDLQRDRRRDQQFLQMVQPADPSWVHWCSAVTSAVWDPAEEAEADGEGSYHRNSCIRSRIGAKRLQRPAPAAAAMNC